MWRAVELRELRAFLVVAEELHFGRAAERLQITRSRVSQLVAELEAKVGGRLFERTSRRVRLTAAGGRLYSNVSESYAQMERGFIDACTVAAGAAGPVRIGTYVRLNLGPYWPQVVEAFRTGNAGCPVNIVDIKLDQDYLDVLRRGEVDMLAARLPISDTDMTVGPILSDENRIVLVARDHPLAGRSMISVVDLTGYTLNDAPAMPREMIDAFLPPTTTAGIKLPRVSLSSVEEAMILIANGQLVYLTVASFATYYSDPSIVAVPVSDLPPSKTALVWLTANRSPKIHALVAAASTIAQHPQDQAAISGRRPAPPDNHGHRPPRPRATASRTSATRDGSPMNHS